MLGWWVWLYARVVGAYLWHSGGSLLSQSNTECIQLGGKGQVVIFVSLGCLPLFEEATDNRDRTLSVAGSKLHTLHVQFRSEGEILLKITHYSSAAWWRRGLMGMACFICAIGGI